MKTIKSILFATAFLFAAVSFANPNDATPVSGNYTGTLETKTFLQSDDAARTMSSKDYNVELLFNGTVFIYQSNTAKAMGNYKIEGDKITFEVTSVKGDAEQVNALFTPTYQFSRKDGNLMLISKSGDTKDVNILNLKYHKG